MTRTAVTPAQYPGDDGGVSLTWGNIDFTNGNVVTDSRGLIVVARNANAATRKMRLTSTQKGLTVQKDYTIPVVGSFGQYVLSDIDMKFWGQHGSVDQGYLYLDWPDSAGVAEVQLAIIKRLPGSYA